MRNELGISIFNILTAVGKFNEDFKIDTMKI